MGEEDKNTVILAVQEELKGGWRVPPMMQMTVTGTEEFGFTSSFPSLIREQTGELDFDTVEKMMASGQIAYPMALKKAPISSIVRSPSGFSVECADKRMRDLITKNMQRVLEKRIGEILTMLEYGAYYGEVTYGIGYPQDYDLPKSTVPFWLIEDFNGCHPTTIEKILRAEKTRAFRGFVQMPPGDFRDGPVTISTERALIIPYNGLFGKLEGTSILQPVHVWWFWYELIWRAFLRYLQRQGVGVVVVKAPSRGRVSVNGKNVDNMQWALQMASSLHRTNYAALPSDSDENGNALWAIDYLKMGQDEGRQFVAALELLANNIKLFLLTGSGLTDDSGEFEVMLNTEETLAHIAMYINNHVLPKMLMWNGSSTRIATMSFQGANSRVLPLIFKLLAVAGNTTGEALQNVDWRLLMAEGGVPVLSEEEVEELKDEQFAEFKRMQEVSAKPADGEKAKGQPGGEGRWASQRDKEGRAESLEMISEALNTPIIALSAPQVATMEELGVRAGEGPVVLFNPYHDKGGRFTDKAHASKPLPKNKLIAHGLDNRNEFLVADATSLAYERVGQAPRPVMAFGKKNEFVNSLCATYPARHKVVCVRRSPRAYAIYRDGKTYVSPKGVRAIAKDRKFGEYVMTHEAFHGKKRSDGSYGADVSYEKVGVFKRDPTFHRAMARYHIEEGSTDLLARMAHGVDYNYNADSFFAGAPAYMGQMGALAILAGIATDWDKAAAWKLINMMHYKINDDQYIFELLSDAFGEPANGWDGSSYYALMMGLQDSAEEGNYAELAWLFSEEKNE